MQKNKLQKNNTGFIRIVDFCDAISSRTKGASQKFTTGFTIIEMMIAIAIFLVVVIYGMQALLNANFVHKKSQNMRSVMDSLTFALDDMSKNIRIGYNYHCLENDSDFYAITDNKPKSCKDGIGISFISSNGHEEGKNDEWAYFIGDKGLWKSTGSTYNKGIDDVRLTSKDIVLDEKASGFSILGAESPTNGDKQQPLVVIRLVGEMKGSAFSIETAVSQRLIDVANTGALVPVEPDAPDNPGKVIEPIDSKNPVKPVIINEAIKTGVKASLSTTPTKNQ